jgi:hypothetical protein
MPLHLANPFDQLIEVLLIHLSHPSSVQRAP